MSGGGPGFQRREGRWGGFVLLGLALALVAACGLRFANLVEARDEADAKIDRLERRASRPAPAREPGVDAALGSAMQKIDASLNVPWDTLFQALEHATVPGVYVMQVQPQAEQRRVQVAAEAPDLDIASLYVSTLSRQPGMRHVHLASYAELNGEGQRGFRFEVVAHWDEPPAAAEGVR